VEESQDDPLEHLKGERDYGRIDFRTSIKHEVNRIGKDVMNKLAPKPINKTAFSKVFTSPEKKGAPKSQNPFGKPPPSGKEFIKKKSTENHSASMVASSEVSETQFDARFSTLTSARYQTTTL